MSLSRISIYETWENEDSIDERIATIKELVSKRIPQRDIAKVLGISERVLIKLKKEQVCIRNAFIFGDMKLKDTLVNSIYEKAIGIKLEDTNTTIEESKTGRKKKIVKTTKSYPPDFQSARYLLITKFGRDYNERKEELDLMDKRYRDKEEEWK
jgi:hypothetical protein